MSKLSLSQLSVSEKDDLLRGKAELIKCILAQIEDLRRKRPSPGVSRLMQEMFGLSISEGPISNALSRSLPVLEEERARIRADLRKAPVIASDETRAPWTCCACQWEPVIARFNGATWRRWTFVSETAVLHVCLANLMGNPCRGSYGTKACVIADGHGRGPIGMRSMSMGTQTGLGLCAGCGAGL